MRLKAGDWEGLGEEYLCSRQAVARFGFKAILLEPESVGSHTEKEPLRYSSSSGTKGGGSRNLTQMFSPLPSQQQIWASL